MSFDRTYDAEDIEPAAVRPLRAAPGLERGRETGGRGETDAGRGPRDRATGELASENADLYRRNAEQGRTIEQLQARLDMSEARSRAWAGEMANREDVRAARDEARDKREEALTGRIAELERRDSGDGSALAGRLEEPSAARAESVRLERTRGRPSDAKIAVGVAWASIALSAVAQATGTPETATLAAYATEVIAAAAAHVALYREHRKASRGDRTRD